MNIKDNLKNNKNQNTVKCRGQKTVTLFCSNKLCKQKNTFFCSDIKCKCYEGHKYCLKFHIDIVLEDINKKVGYTQQFKSKIFKIFNQFIQRIKKTQNRIIQFVDQKLKLMNLSEIQLNVYKLFIQNKGRVEQFNGQSLNKLMGDIQQNNYNKFGDIFQKYLNQIQNLKKKCELQLNKNVRKLKQFLKSKNEQNNISNLLYEQNQNTHSKIQQKQNKIVNNDKKTINLPIAYQPCIVKQQDCIQVDGGISQKSRQWTIQQNNKIDLQMLSSQIIKNEEQLTNLINFFDRKVKNLTVMFKASQNQFKMEKYYQKCGNLKNTIILCETLGNKILGGYTPISLNPIIQQDQMVADYKFQTFTFSLTHNHKFTLKKKQKAITRIAKRDLICFGNGFFEIGNYANRYSFNSSLYLNNVFVNKKYKDSLSSYKKLTGYLTENLYVKQWEAVQVEFQEENC